MGSSILQHTASSLEVLPALPGNPASARAAAAETAGSKAQAAAAAARRGRLTQRASAWEEVPILVEGDGHDSVGGVEGLLHAVAVVDVDVHVQHAAGRGMKGGGGGARARGLEAARRAGGNCASEKGQAALDVQSTRPAPAPCWPAAAASQRRAARRVPQEATLPGGARRPSPLAGACRPQPSHSLGAGARRRTMLHVLSLFNSPLVHLQQLQDCQHNVVDVAETCRGGRPRTCAIHDKSVLRTVTLSATPV